MQWFKAKYSDRSRLPKCFFLNQEKCDWFTNGEKQLRLLVSSFIKRKQGILNLHWSSNIDTIVQNERSKNINKYKAIGFYRNKLFPRGILNTTGFALLKVRCDNAWCIVSQLILLSEVYHRSACVSTNVFVSVLRMIGCVWTKLVETDIAYWSVYRHDLSRFYQCPANISRFLQRNSQKCIKNLNWCNHFSHSYNRDRI